MLNEKKVIQDKLFIYTMLAVSAGFFLGLASLTLLLLFTVNMSPGGGIAATLLLLISVILGVLSDKVYQQIRAFINQPYIEEEKEVDQNEKTNLDSPAD